MSVPQIRRTLREEAERAGEFEPVGPERSAAAPVIHWGSHQKLGAIIDWAVIAHKERGTGHEGGQSVSPDPDIVGPSPITSDTSLEALLPPIRDLDHKVFLPTDEIRHERRML